MPTHYEILEIQIDATEIEIKKAYKRLALIYHPDRNYSDPDNENSGKGGKEAKEKFQAIQSAYEVLSDPAKKRDYDYSLNNARSSGYSNGFHNARPTRGSGFEWNSPGFGMGRKTNIVTLKVTLEECFNGASKVFEITRQRSCGTCHGSGAKSNAIMRGCSKCNGTGLSRNGNLTGNVRFISECTDCEGLGRRYRPQDLCKKCTGKGTVQEKKRLTVDIPKFSREGKRIVFSQEGDQSAKESIPSDLEIVLTILPHPTFNLTRSLSTRISLTLVESLLGFERVILRTLDGRALRVKAPGGEWTDGRVIKIQGEGWDEGTLEVNVSVEGVNKAWLENLSAEDKEQLEQILPGRKEDLSAEIKKNGVEVSNVQFSYK